MLTFAILAAIAIGVMKFVKAYFPKSFGYTTRQSLLNVFRPNNQTVVLVVGIGLGTFLISTLYFTKDILLSKTEIGQTTETANMIILDVQSEQREAVEESLTRNKLPVLTAIPLVTMRMHKIKDQLVNDIRQDSTREVRGWILNHEFRTTYRDTLLDSEELIAGEWIPSLTKSDPVVISISDNVVNSFL